MAATTVEPDNVRSRRRGYWRDVWVRLRRNRLAMASLYSEARAGSGEFQGKPKENVRAMAYLVWDYLEGGPGD